MEHRCFWSDPAYIPGPSLEEKVSAKVLVVGGGVAGLFTAHFLNKLGMTDIVVLEKGDVGSGSSSYSAGIFVCEEIETASWPTLVEDIGFDLAKRYIAAHFEAKKEALRVIEEIGTDCDLVTHDLTLLNSSSNERLEKEARLRKELGSEFRVFDTPAQLPDGSADIFKACAFIERMPSFDPIKFYHGIGASLRHRGVRIYENSPLRIIEGNIAKTDSGEVHFDTVVFARGIVEKGPDLATYLTSVCVTAPLSERMLTYLKDERKEAFLSSLLNELSTFYYGTITYDKRLLVGYGDELVDTDTLEAPLIAEHAESMEAFIRDFLHEQVAIEYGWTAAYQLSKRTLPYLSLEGNAYTIGGAGTQVTNVVLGSFAAHKIMGKEHPLDPVFL